MPAMDSRRLPLPGRRAIVLGLPALAAACAGNDTPPPLTRLVDGYGHLTPIRLDVAEIDVADPGAGVVRVDEPAPVRPDREMLRMARERIQAMGNAGQGRFVVEVAEFRRERLAGGNALTSLFTGEPGERLTCRLKARLEVRSEARGTGFVEAEARRQRTLADGASPAERRRAAEEVVRQAMDDLNVELEFQVRRTLRDWLLEAAVPAPAPVGPAGIEREELQRRR
jgi:hypothetical protein